ncbi:solute carrier family 35 member B1 homolog [Episyrphus balteatus]|uniref:solute carrier family 35 member B1 homolog n=1 Tax=Episyrphus balteatus TaxID=286459 RepID=UPI00248576D8|nr:solute carrier family 35 member B1 homolog [Episyrphus balteatus]
MINEKYKFIFYSVGIFCCYFYYGIIQEKITRGQYGNTKNEDGTTGERFTCALAMVCVQCFCNAIFAKGMLLAKPQKDDTTPTSYYAVCSLTYLLAMVSSNMALRWVPYPTQVVGKSAKPIPVMILGVLIGRKSYSWTRYGCVMTIVAGVVLFMYKEGKVNSNLAQEKTGLGELLLLLSLSMDGFTGAVQERMRSSSAPTGQQMMLSMNFWSSMMLGSAMIFTGEGKDFLLFTSRHPQLLTHLATLAFAGALGQLFIFLMVAGFGPLACSVVTTTRKFFTVLFSVIFFGNLLIPRQWLGAILVFVGLFADMVFGKKSTAKKPVADDKKKLLS